MLLKVEKLHVARSGVLIVRDINLYVNKGEVVGLIGPNGAGKTTLLGAIMGLYLNESGQIEFEGNQIQKVETQKISKNISLAFQEEAVFPFLNVMENLWVAKRCTRKELLKDEVFEIFPILSERLDQEACTLSGGQRQALAIAMSLVRKTKLLLLDEPTLGLSPIMVNTTIETIRRINEKYELSILISEQNPRILEICNRVYVLEGGQIRMEGSGRDFQCDERICKVYLGVSV